MSVLNHIDLKICMLGCCEVGYYIVRNLIEEGLKFSYFVILSKEQGEKYNVSGYFDFSILAKKYSIPIYYPKSYSLDKEEDYNFFVSNKFDLVILRVATFNSSKYFKYFKNWCYWGAWEF